MIKDSDCLSLNPLFLDLQGKNDIPERESRGNTTLCSNGVPKYLGSINDSVYAYF